MLNLHKNKPVTDLVPETGTTNPAKDDKQREAVNSSESTTSNHSLTTPSGTNNTGGGTSLHQIETMLTVKYQFKYNAVSEKVEFRLVNTPDAPYEDMRDYDYNSILRRIKKAGIPCSKDTLRTTLASDFVLRYDPYLQYINGLPAWDGEDHIGRLADTVKTNNQEFFRETFKKWFVTMTVSWTEVKVINHTVLILSGKQGIGKTRWIEHLVPNPLERYVSSEKINIRDKDSQIKLSECPLINLDELENLSPQNVDGLKELITKQHIYLRRAYAYTHNKYVRRASFAGSINNPEFLHDITGNRRFLCFEALEVDYEHNIDLDQACAQAMALYKNKFRYWLSSEDIQELEKHNDGFRVVSAEEEQLTTFYMPCDPADKDAQLLKTTDILRKLREFSGLRSLSVQKLGKVLHAQKFQRLKRKDRYVYALKPVPAEGNSPTPTE